MPFTERQRRAAGAELGRRRSGTKKSAKRPTKNRPFADMDKETLRDLAKGPLKKRKAAKSAKSAKAPKRGARK